MLNPKDLLAGLSFQPASVEPHRSGLAGPVKRGAAYLLIPQGLLAKLLKRNGERSLNLKDLLATLHASVESTLFGPFGFCRATEAWRGQSIDFARVVGRIADEKRRGLAQSKGLTSHASREHRNTFSGFGRAGERGAPNLLIQNGLLAKLLRRNGKGSLN
ncbi:MAG TPA: hypothetical protein VKM93_01030, partial [Terriglobia bacterium]|nr:hypothetical protein [Terriglobia bacterium]